jgi:hypothetical protein
MIRNERRFLDAEKVRKSKDVKEISNIYAFCKYSFVSENIF